MRLYRRGDDASGLCQSLALLSFMEFEVPTGDPERGSAAGSEALELGRENGDLWIRLFALCANLWLASDFSAAKRLADEALTIGRELAVPDQQAMVLSNIGFRALE